MVALSGTAYAAGLPRNSVGTAQLRTGAVTAAKLEKNAVSGQKVRNRSLTGQDVADGSIGGVDLAAGAVTPDALGTPLAVKVRMVPGAPTVVAGASFLSAAAFEEEVYDTGDLWDPATPDRITIARTGLWLLQGQAHFEANSTGLRHVALVSPADSPSPADALANTTALPTSAGFPIQVATVARLEQGDTVSLSTFKSAAAALALDNGYATYLTATYLGVAPG